MKTQIGDAYAKYMSRVVIAQNRGYSNQVIIDELLRERETLAPRSTLKAATLALDRNIYKKREVYRAEQECRNAIDRILKELEAKEITA